MVGDTDFDVALVLSVLRLIRPLSVLLDSSVRLRRLCSHCAIMHPMRGVRVMSRLTIWRVSQVRLVVRSG